MEDTTKVLEHSQVRWHVDREEKGPQHSAAQEEMNEIAVSWGLLISRGQQLMSCSTDPTCGAILFGLQCQSDLFVILAAGVFAHMAATCREKVWRWCYGEEGKGKWFWGGSKPCLELSSINAVPHCKMLLTPGLESQCFQVSTSKTDSWGLVLEGETASQTSLQQQEVTKP